MTGQFFVAAGTLLLSRCLATKKWIRFTEYLPRKDRRDTHRDKKADGKIL
jgi:hypothetical protein